MVADRAMQDAELFKRDTLLKCILQLAIENQRLPCITHCLTQVTHFPKCLANVGQNNLPASIILARLVTRDAFLKERYRTRGLARILIAQCKRSPSPASVRLAS